MELKFFSAESTDLIWEISTLAGHFHVSCYDPVSKEVGSGFSMIQETAKKKAFSEINERHLVRQLMASNARNAWLLDYDTSGSGFAVGYSRSKALLRAICEGAERWALSKWIDEGFRIAPIANPISSQVCSSISSFFASTTQFRVEVPVVLDGRLLKVHVAVLLGWTENGVFAGYGAKLGIAEAIEHAHVEALRNLLIHNNQPVRATFPYNRIRFFAQNKVVAQDVISSRLKRNWPMPNLKFAKAEKFGELWLARAVFNGWEPWQFGSVHRFLY